MTWYSFIIDFLTYAIFIYSLAMLLSYVGIGLYSIGETRRYIHENSFTDYRILAASAFAPSVSIIAPAYNEGLTITDNVRSLLSIYYANLEVIIVNDGSKDDCLQKMIDGYDLYKVDFYVRYQLPTKKVRGVYKSRNPIFSKLVVVDKENGGKADALNVGINIASNDYVVCIDVDCILEQEALLKIMKPFMDHTKEKVIASGGVVRIANSCVIEHGKLIKVNLPKEYLPRLQSLEYIRAFILGRMAWSRLNGLMLISGAFGAFDKEIVIKAGGYNHKTVGEDMELVVRMRKYMADNDQPYRVTYVPDPLCWTESPNSFTILGRQRNRWLRGTVETLSLHKTLFFNPKYGLMGLLSYPYWFFFEMLAPVLEFFGFIVFLILTLIGFLDWDVFFAYLLLIICFGYLYSVFAILMEVTTFNQYKRRTDIMWLMISGLTEPFYFHPFVVWSGIMGFVDLFRKKNVWGEMVRQGFGTPAASSAPLQPAITTIPAKENDIVPVSVKKELEARIIQKANNQSAIINYIKDTWSKSSVMLQPLKFIIEKTWLAWKNYWPYATVLLLLLLHAKVTEIGLDLSMHGKPNFFTSVIGIGLLKDIGYFLWLAPWLFIPFAIAFYFNHRIARIVFSTICIILILIQSSLTQYFLTTLVPLGADLWGYSIADIKQTVGAAGGFNFTQIAIFIAAIGIVILAFKYLPKYFRFSNFAAAIAFIAITVCYFGEVPAKIMLQQPGQEHSNNLSANKSYFFLYSSLNHFFPPETDLDIFADGYIGDYNDNNSNSSTSSFKYIDEQQYPFLHQYDSTADVLSPFFKKDSSLKTPPNIVMILIEGMGRAYSNKGAYLGSWTPFLDSLSESGLYWENFLSEGGRTFAVLPSVIGSVPFAKNGFASMEDKMPAHLSLVNILRYNNYHTSFIYGGNANFDFMDVYLNKTNIHEITEEKNFGTGYAKMPASSSGTTWGYGDRELMEKFLSKKAEKNLQPHLSIILTVSTHSPFLINNQDIYLRKVEENLSKLSLDAAKRAELTNYKNQFASIMYVDDAVRYLINSYKQKPEFKNTVFVITGDHRMPEIPIATKIDRFHVPFIIYSPMLNRPAKFSAVSTHFDITPSLLMWLKRSYKLDVPATAHWMGNGLDTNRNFRNTKSYPFMPNKYAVDGFISGNYFLDGNDLFRVEPSMNLVAETDNNRKDNMKGVLERIKLKNEKLIGGYKLVPDSLLKKYYSR